MKKYSTVDDYINDQNTDVAARLRTVRHLFHEIVPKTEESIRYDMPAFTIGDEHLYVAAYKNHIGMYPMYGISELDTKMLPYRGKGTKDALHFRHTEALPIELIKEIIAAKKDK